MMPKGPLEPGFLVALTLRPDAAPLRCYVGEVQMIDERGIRVTLIDWLIGSCCGWDLFVPWEQVTSALVSTSEHDANGFGDDAARWQERMHPATESADAAEGRQEGERP